MTAREVVYRLAEKRLTGIKASLIDLPLLIKYHTELLCWDGVCKPPKCSSCQSQSSSISVLSR